MDAPAQPRCFWNGEVGYGELASQRKTIRLDRVVHTCNHNIWEVEAEENQEFRTSPGSTVSCRAPWAIGDVSEQSTVSEVVKRRCILYRNSTTSLKEVHFLLLPFAWPVGMRGGSVSLPDNEADVGQQAIFLLESDSL